jgi:hypothetical protein
MEGTKTFLQRLCYGHLFKTGVNLKFKRMTSNFNEYKVSIKLTSFALGREGKHEGYKGLHSLGAAPCCYQVS